MNCCGLLHQTSSALAVSAVGLQDIAQLSGGPTAQVIEPGTEEVTFDTVGSSFGTSLTPDQPNNRIIVNTSGTYLIQHTVRWEAGSLAATQRESNFSVNGATPNNRNIQPYGLGNLMYSNVNIRTLAAADLVTLRVTHNDPGNINILSRVLTVIRIR